MYRVQIILQCLLIIADSAAVVAHLLCPLGMTPSTPVLPNAVCLTIADQTSPSVDVEQKALLIKEKKCACLCISVKVTYL